MNSLTNTKLIVMLLLLVLIPISVFSQQNPIINSDHIPIITYQGLDFYYLNQYWFQKMKHSGIDAVVSQNLTKDKFDNNIRNISDLLVMPEQQSSNIRNYIYKYTEAIYTVWEAEGTPPEEGEVQLYSDSIECIKENGLVSTLPTTQNGTLIYGPMYSQQRHYAFVDGGQIIDYTADYRLMIEETDPSLKMRTEDTVCILQVTTTKTFENNQWGWYDEYIIAESVVRYGDFDKSGEMQRFALNYNLANIPNEYYNSNNSYLMPVSFRGTETQRTAVNCIQFKVKWKGNPQLVKLSVDKIIISDYRGRELFFIPSTTDSIVTQITENRMNFGTDRIAGWIGLDEPWALDFWASIKKVQEILNSNNAELFFQFNIGWNGRFGNYSDTGYTMKLEKFDELMRRVKKANIWVVMNPFDWP